MDSYILTVNGGKQSPTRPEHFYFSGDQWREQADPRATLV